MPGAPFHVTARLHAGERLFEGIEQRIVDLIVRTAAQEKTQIVAYAVMPNHLHLMVVHSQRPLGTLMQALLRRVALLVQRRHGRVGRVFERPYRDQCCLDPIYARNAVAYIHLNPVRAGLCVAPADYQWTSHRAYSADSSHPDGHFEASVRSFIGLFAEDRDAGLASCRTAYQRFVAWRMALDQLERGEGSSVVARPEAWGGDTAWQERFGDLMTGRPSWTTDSRVNASRADLEDIARSVIRDEAPGLPLDCVRHNGKMRQHVAVRRTIILRSLAAGYPNHRIARYLRVTDATVSKVRRMALTGACMPRSVE